MSTKIIKELAILIGIFLIIWLAFIYIPLRPEAPETLISLEQEQKIGDLLIDAYLEDVDILSDSTVNAAVNQIYIRLLEGIDTTDYDYHIYVVNNESINAFASLGGNIVIFSGLIEFSDSPEEVAAVIAHEMGHVEKRHVVNKVVKELGVELVLSILSGGDPGFLNQILQQSVSTVFDRKQEAEADDYGLELLENSQIHPNSMAVIFRKIRDKYSNATFESLEFLSSHPNTNKRIKKSLSYKPKEGFQSRAFKRIDWELVKDALQ
ncbi:MAG: M48 family metallopeptidase [Bacteroidota bacterium]